jgi:hypothetical protein
METTFPRASRKLKDNVLKIAGLVEDAGCNSVQSLVKRDSEVVQRTFEGEDRINALVIKHHADTKGQTNDKKHLEAAGRE